MLQVRGDDHAPELLRQLKQRVFAHGDPDPRALSQGLDILAGTDLRADLEQVACPALVISGERDRLTPPEAGCRLAGMIPDARYVQIGKAAHAPFLSHRREFVAAVAAFTGIAA
jgi:pimeloyl-[acyl-carrier protein] methyl ester esterase